MHALVPPGVDQRARRRGRSGGRARCAPNPTACGVYRSPAGAPAPSVPARCCGRRRPSPDWHASSNGHALARSDAFGWTNAFALDAHAPRRGALRRRLGALGARASSRCSLWIARRGGVDRNAPPRCGSSHEVAARRLRRSRSSSWSPPRSRSGTASRAGAGGARRTRGRGACWRARRARCGSARACRRPCRPPRRRVTFANIGTAPADLAVTVLADKGKPSHRNLTVAASSVVTQRRDRSRAGRRVDHRDVRRARARRGGRRRPERHRHVAVRDRRRRRHWHFAAGTTPRGVQQWLVIDDPYASDAKVDVTMRTNDGVRDPSSSRASTSPAGRGRSSPSTTSRCATTASRSRSTRGSARSSPRRRCVQLRRRWPRCRDDARRRPRRSDHWSLAGGASVSGATRWVAIANDGDDDAQVEVQAVPENGEAVPPVDAHRRPGRRRVGPARQLPDERRRAACAMPDGTRYCLDVRSEQRRAGRRADAHARARDGDDSRRGDDARLERSGAALGVRDAVGRRRASTTLAFVNPLAQRRAGRASRVVREGRVDHPDSLQAITVPPGRAHDRARRRTADTAARRGDDRRRVEPGVRRADDDGRRRRQPLRRHSVRVNRR